MLLSVSCAVTFVIDCNSTEKKIYKILHIQIRLLFGWNYFNWFSLLHLGGFFHIPTHKQARTHTHTHTHTPPKTAYSIAYTSIGKWYRTHTVCVFLDFSLRILFSLLPQRRIPRTNTQMATDYVNIYQYLNIMGTKKTTYIQRTMCIFLLFFFSFFLSLFVRYIYIILAVRLFDGFFFVVCAIVWMLITRPRKFSQCKNSTYSNRREYTRNNSSFFSVPTYLPGSQPISHWIALLFRLIVYLANWNANIKLALANFFVISISYVSKDTKKDIFLPLTLTPNTLISHCQIRTDERKKKNSLSLHRIVVKPYLRYASPLTYFTSVT